MRITSLEASKIMMRKLLSRVPHLAWELFNIHLSVSDTVYSFVTLYLLQISLNIFKDERSFFMISLVKNQAWLQDAERQTSVCHRG